MSSGDPCRETAVATVSMRACFIGTSRQRRRGKESTSRSFWAWRWSTNLATFCWAPKPIQRTASCARTGATMTWSLGPRVNFASPISRPNVSGLTFSRGLTKESVRKANYGLQRGSDWPGSRLHQAARKASYQVISESCLPYLTSTNGLRWEDPIGREANDSETNSWNRALVVHGGN